MSCRNPSVLGLPSFAPLDYAVRFRRRRAFASLEATLRRSGGTLPAVRFATLSALVGLAIPKLHLRAAARRPRQDCGAVCHGSAFLHTTPPVFPQIRKKGGVAASLRGYQIPTLPTRPQRFRAWTIPTLSRPPSPASRRNGRTACVHPLPEPRHHRDGEPGFR